MLWNSKDHRRVHISPQLFPTLIQVNLVHPIPSYSFRAHFNIIFQFTSGISCGRLPLDFPTRTLYALYALPISSSINIMTYEEENKSRIISLCYFLQPKHLSQHPIFEHLLLLFLPRCENQTFNRPTACVNSSGSKAGRQETLARRVADIR